MPTPTRRHALILGAAGFIGSHLTDRLLTAGYTVTGLDNFTSGHIRNLAAAEAHPRWDGIHHADVTDPAWTSLRQARTADVVIHLASPASPPAYAKRPVETLLANAQGTLNAARLCVETGARLLFASTSEVYGDPTVHPQPEDYNGNVSPDGPRSMYDEGKRYAEALIAAHRPALDAAVVRIFNTYGPRMDPYDGRVVPTFIRQAAAGEPLTIAGDGRQTRSFCYVDDLTAGLQAVLESRTPGPVNLGNPAEFTINDLALDVARLTAEQTGRTPEFCYVPAAPDDPTRRQPVITRARGLGWQPETYLTAGLRRTITAYLETR